MVVNAVEQRVVSIIYAGMLDGLGTDCAPSSR